MSFEHPPSQESEENKKSIETLSQALLDALIEDTGSELSFGEKAYQALIEWQQAAEDKATLENTSLANIEVIVQRAEIFIEANRMLFAEQDLADARLAAENDSSVGEEVIQKIKDLQVKL